MSLIRRLSLLLTVLSVMAAPYALAENQIHHPDRPASPQITATHKHSTARHHQHKQPKKRTQHQSRKHHHRHAIQH